MTEAQYKITLKTGRKYIREIKEEDGLRYFHIKDKKYIIGKYTDNGFMSISNVAIQSFSKICANCWCSESIDDLYCDSCSYEGQCNKRKGY